MNETEVHGVRVRFRNDIDSDAVENLRSTLAVVPREHRAAIRQIDVVPPSSFGHGPTYAGGGSGVGYPCLSELCFDRTHRPHNFPLNMTLLHEIGHVLENSFHCRRHLDRESRRIIDSVPIPESARTHGLGEHYAIAYQKVLSRTATQQIREAVFSSRAFRGVDTARL